MPGAYNVLPGNKLPYSSASFSVLRVIILHVLALVLITLLHAFSTPGCPVRWRCRPLFSRHSDKNNRALRTCIYLRYCLVPWPGGSRRNNGRWMILRGGMNSGITYHRSRVTAIRDMARERRRIEPIPAASQRQHGSISSKFCGTKSEIRHPIYPTTSDIRNPTSYIRNSTSAVQLL